MDGKEKLSLFDRIKKLMNATEAEDSQNAEEEKEPEQQKKRPIMEEIFSDKKPQEGNDSSKITHLSSVRQEKERQELERQKEQLKQELKEELKQELKAEIISDAEKEMTEQTAENSAQEKGESTMPGKEEEKPEVKAEGESRKPEAIADKEEETAGNKNEEQKPEPENIQKSKEQKPEVESTQKSEEPAKQQENGEYVDISTRTKINIDKITVPTETNVHNTAVNINNGADVQTKEDRDKLKLEKKLKRQKEKEEKRLEKQKKLEEKLSRSAYSAADEDMTVFSRISGKLSAFLGFINDKSDEFAPDDIYLQRDAVQTSDMAQAQELTRAKIEVKNTPEAKKRPKTQESADSSAAKADEKTEKNKKAAQQKKDDKDSKKEKIIKVPVLNVPVADIPKAAGTQELIKNAKEQSEKVQKQIRAENAEARSQEKKEKQNRIEAKPREVYTNGFEKMSALHLSDEEREKLLVNGVRVPEYIHESDVYRITLASDKIQYAIKKEYEGYIKQEIRKEKAEKKTERAQRAEREEVREKTYAQKPQKDENKQEEHKTIKEKLFGSYENAAEKADFAKLREVSEEQPDDFERVQDTRAVGAEISIEASRLLIRCVITAIIFVLAFAVTAMQKFFPGIIQENVPNADVMFCAATLLLLAVSAAICNVTVLSGLKPLISFKGNADTAVSVACVAAFIQCIISIFDASEYFAFNKNLYAIIVMLALFLNTLGKYLVQQRIKNNFRFITNSARKYTVKIMDESQAAYDMVSGTKADKPIIAYQRRTKFLKNFLKLSYAPDPSQTMAARFAPICTAFAVLIAIVYGIIYKNPGDAISALTAVLCVGIPVCCMLAVNLPMKSLCKTAVNNNAMVAGYPAVKQFCETRAIMADARELYPRGRVELIAVKMFSKNNADKAFINAAAVLKIANTPLTYIFEDVITDKNMNLPNVESVKYEDGKGLISWVNGERLLLGTRELMQKYSVDIPSVDFEQRNKEDDSNKITYLANAGQLIAMLVTNYKADKRIINEFKRLENTGVTVLVRTADPNITQDSIAKDFKIYFRSVKILPVSLGNICKEEMSVKEEESPAYISTRGKIYSLARAVSGCIRMKNSISIAIVIQAVAIILGLLLISVIAITAGLSGLGVLELLLYTVFWAAAAVIAPMLQKP